MKKLVEFFMKKKIVFKKLHSVDKKRLNTRKKITIYLGIDLKGYYNVIILQSKKSRILQKEVIDIDEIAKLLQEEAGVTIKKRYYLFDAPICSKAKDKLKELDWKFYDFS